MPTVVLLTFRAVAAEKNLLLMHVTDRNVSYLCLGATYIEDVLRLFDSTFRQFLAADVCRVSSDL